MDNGNKHTALVLNNYGKSQQFAFTRHALRMLERVAVSVAMNEPVNYAIRSAIEYCVIEVIQQGADQGLWKMKEETHEKIH